MPLLVLSAEDVDQIIRDCLSLSEILKNQADVFRTLEKGDGNESTEPAFEAPLRTVLSQKTKTTLVMPARLDDQIACKLVSVPRESSGLSAATAVLDAETGSLKAIVNAASLTALRTAAGSALATLILQPLTRFQSRQPQRMTIFGGGKQAIHHAALLSSIYQNSCQIDFILRSTSTSSTSALQRGLLELRLKPENIRVIINSDLSQVEESVSQADIIVCCTPSQQPLFPSAWVQSGAHIVLVGSYKPSMQEVEVELVRRAYRRIIVDDREACAAEAGDLIKAGLRADECISLGQVLLDPSYERLAHQNMQTINEGPFASFEQTKKFFDRQNQATTEAVHAGDGDITIFKSVGVGLQDVAITSLIVERAIAQGIGRQVPF